MDSEASRKENASELAARVNELGHNMRMCVCVSVFVRSRRIGTSPHRTFTVFSTFISVFISMCF